MTTGMSIQSDLSGLAVGDDIVMHDGQGITVHRKVAGIGRVYLTDDEGWQFELATGRAHRRHQVGIVAYAETVERWQARSEFDHLTERLREWGWYPGSRGRSLTLPQLRRAAALLSEFDSERSGGRL